MVNKFYIILAPGKLLLIFFSLLCREGIPVPLGYKKMPNREARLGLETIPINFYQYHYTTDF